MGPFEPGDAAQGGCLATSGRPQKGNHLAGLHREADTVDGGHPLGLGLEDLGQVFYSYHCFPLDLFFDAVSCGDDTCHRDQDNQH